MARRLFALPRILAVVGVFFAAWVCCYQRPANSQEVASLGEDNGPPPRRRLSSTEQALLDSAGGQYGAYAELLLTFSADGRLPIFHEKLDLGDDDPVQAIENHKKLTEITDQLIAQRDRAQGAIDQLSDRPDESNSMDDFWSLRLLQLHPATDVSLLAVDSLIKPGFKFWEWAANARRRARANVLGIAYADPKKNKILAGEQKMLRERIYEVAKDQFGDDPAVGGSEIEFYKNLKDGKLDHLTQRIHTEMSQDGTNAGLTYMSVAGTQSKRPIDVVYDEGCRGLEKGVDLYIAAGKTVVAAGLGPSAGKDFNRGFDKAKDACDKIENAEKEYKKFKEDPAGYVKDKAIEKLKKKGKELATKKGTELLQKGRKNIRGFRKGENFLRDANDMKNEIEQAAKDPAGYLLGKVEGKLNIAGRAKKFIKDKTNLSDDVADFLGKRISENVTEMSRNVVIGEIVDKELEKAGGDPEKIDMKKPLRRIKDAGWDYGAVAVTSKGNDANPGGTIAVWKDPATGRVKTTLQPVATGKTDVIPLPGNAQVDVLEVDGQGQVESITESPVTVDSDQVVSIDSDDGTTKRVSYDDHFEEGSSDTLVDADNENTPDIINVMHGVNKVDLSQLFPPSNDTDEPMKIMDYDEDNDDETNYTETIGRNIEKQQRILEEQLNNSNDTTTNHDGDGKHNRRYRDDGPTTLRNLTDRIKYRRVKERSDDR